MNSYMDMDPNTKPLNTIFIIFLILIFLAGFYFIYWTTVVVTPKPVIVEVPSEPIQVPPTEPCPNLLIRKGNELLLTNTSEPEVPGINPIKFSNLDEYIFYIKVQREKHGKYCPVLYLQQETNTQGEDVYRVRPGPFDLQGGLSPTQNPQYFTAPLVNYLGKAQSIGVGVGPVPFNANVNSNTIPIPLTQPYLPMPNIAPQPALTATIPAKPVGPLNPAHPPLVPYLDANHDSPPYNAGFLGFDPQGEYIGKYTVLDEIHHLTRTQNPNGLSTNAMDPNWAGAKYTTIQLSENNSKKGPGSVDFSLNTSSSNPYSTYDMKNNISLAAANYGSSPTGPPPYPFGSPVTPSSYSPSPSVKSDNALDANWGGVKHTKADVNTGKYEQNNVKIYVDNNA